MNMEWCAWNPIRNQLRAGEIIQARGGGGGLPDKHQDLSPEYDLQN